MPVTWTIEKIEQEIKKAKNIADIANIFSLVFGLSRIEKEIADYERLEAMADAVQRTREPSSLDLFDVPKMLSFRRQKTKNYSTRQSRYRIQI